MLPPIPQGLVPVTAQQDVPKPKPPVAPVTPAAETAKGSAVSLERDDISAAQQRARDEERRRQQREQAQSEGDVESASLEDGQEGRELSRKGLWVDVKV